MEIEIKKLEEVKDAQTARALEGIKPNMTRKERRAWFRANKKKLGLPDWSALQNIKAI